MIKTIFRFSYIFLLAVTLLATFVSSEADAESTTIEVLTVKGTIVPAVANYIERGISEAETNGSTACIIELDTPGGLLNSTEEIVQHILNAKIPVVVYVTPSGSWAASAGTFITIASHIAVMTPGTTIGAAHPVSGGGQEMSEDVSKKVTEFSAAWIRSIAEARGRDPVQAELAVTESKSFTDSQALEYNLVDFIATDLDSLIGQLNGRKVTLSSGEEITINVTGNVVIRNEMNFAERFLHMISDPNLAYILLSLASIGLITEIANPGMIFPGVAGVISLLIAFYALGTLDAYWVGILLVLLAFGLFIAEIFTPTFGILTAGGVVSLVLGSLTMFSNNPPALDISRGLIAVVAVVIAAFVIFIIGAVVRGQKRQVTTGTEGLIGRVAVAKTKLNPKGTVIIDGEHWSAVVSSGRVEPGEEVTVTEVDGLKLGVTKQKK